MRQDLTIRKLQVIGQAVKNLRPCEIPVPQIPGNRSQALRDKVIHDYFGVNLEIRVRSSHGDPREADDRIIENGVCSVFDLQSETIQQNESRPCGCSPTWIALTFGGAHGLTINAL
jgi:hypothetical protein